MPQSYENGTLLEVRGEPWLVTRVSTSGTCTVLTLEGRGRGNVASRLRVIDPFDRPRRISRAKLRRRPRRAVCRAALAAMMTVRDARSLWTAATATIDLWPYQLEPALAAIGGASRLLLADAVGLGKTIQAGLLLSELRERGWIERVLIICPAGLRDTWARELRDRFSIAATILDQQAIAERIALLPPEVNPWAGHPVAIASIDFVKRPEILAAVEKEPIDLLIADEAHHLAPGTDRGAAVARLAARTPWCVLLSATPHSGDAAAFEYLCGLGSTGDRLTVFRRSRRDAGIHESRRSHVLPVRPTPDESALLVAIDRYARAIWQARGRDDRAVRLTAITLARRAASSATAVERTLVRRLALLNGARDQSTQPLLPWDDDDGSDGLDADAILAAPGLWNEADERADLDTLIALARRSLAGSKSQRLHRLLHVIREPAIVFTEYRDTLDALVISLKGSHRVAAIHGGLAGDVRRGAVDAFNEGRVEVLIATDAAGEGLNLHHRCRLVIDMELPWNPLRLEQRVGRVDRIGQQRTVHAIRMFHPLTIEERVLEHLRLRRRRADHALERCMAEGDLARAIFDGEAIAPLNPPRIPSDTVGAAAAEAGRATSQRAVFQKGAPSHSRSWCATRRPTPIVVVHRATFVNTAGVAIGQRLWAHRVRLTPWPRHGREWRQAIEHIDTELRQAAGLTGHDHSPRPSIERRMAVLRERLARARAIEYQRSLFDGRPDSDALERDQVAGRLDEALGRVRAAVNAAVDTSATHLELIAAWPERRS